MSQLADIEDLVRQQPTNQDQQAKLFFDLLETLGWSIEGVFSVEDAKVYLFMDTSR